MRFSVWSDHCKRFLRKPTPRSPTRAPARRQGAAERTPMKQISRDFDHACWVAANDFGMSWIELRSMWGKNVTDLNDSEIDEAKRILAKYDLRVTDIASPLFKTDWPGAPRSAYGKKGDTFGMAEATFRQQDEILEKSIALARQFGTNKVRCFDF